LSTSPATVSTAPHPVSSSPGEYTLQGHCGLFVFPFYCLSIYSVFECSSTSSTTATAAIPVSSTASTTPAAESATPSFSCSSSAVPPTSEPPLSVSTAPASSTTATTITNTPGQVMLPDLIKLSTSQGDIRILKESAAKYTQIGALLLRDDTGAIVSAMEQSDRVATVEIIYKQWIQEDEDHSWEKLIQCFRDVELNSLARDLELHFGLPSPSDRGNQGRNTQEDVTGTRGDVRKRQSVKEQESHPNQNDDKMTSSGTTSHSQIAIGQCWARLVGQTAGDNFRHSGLNCGSRISYTSFCVSLLGCALA
ncbi:hypothetical protein GBAR_LOCUS785, partial [Geodia barretti]